MDSLGVSGVSEGDKGGTMMGEAFLVLVISPSAVLDVGDRGDESRERTREWKWDVVMGLVSMSY